MTYEFGRIAKLAESLEKFEVPGAVAVQIMEGGEAIVPGTNLRKKAEWMSGAMNRMDELLDEETRVAVREACACCLGGKRNQISRQIGKNNTTLEDRVKAANKAKLVFGNGVSIQDDGTVLVEFQPEGRESYRCVCLKGATEPVSITYCYCCEGHVKHHLQNALGQELKCRVRSSALSSGGKLPCTFVATIEQP